MNQPQLTIQQLEHAIAVYEKRVEAKKLEMESYALLRNHIAALQILAPEDAASSESLDFIKHATVNLFAAKHTVATIELEELELQLKAMRQMRSGVVGANMVIPPFTAKRQ